MGQIIKWLMGYFTSLSEKRFLTSPQAQDARAIAV
jgi:hypothetical protein